MILQNHQLRITTDTATFLTYDNWKLVPSEIPTVASPEVKTEYVEIPGFSTRYDFTEALQGSVPYGARTGEWHFHVIGGDETLRRTIEGAIHGKSATVRLDGADYHGRLFLSEWTNHGNPKWAECTISYDFDA